jgi:hypothetical protein
MSETRRCLPGPLTVRYVFQLVADEVKACAREGLDPGDVRSNLMLVDHTAQGPARAERERIEVLIYERRDQWPKDNLAWRVLDGLARSLEGQSDASPSKERTDDQG